MAKGVYGRGSKRQYKFINLYKALWGRGRILEDYPPRLTGEFLYAGFKENA